jgi:cell division protein FtsI (penicillin-binding protein 3)
MLARRNYKPKLLAILALFLCLYIIIICRLFVIQVYHRDFFKLLAQQQYAAEITTQPPRALIFDRTGAPLTLNRERMSAFILPRQFNDMEATKKILKKHFREAYDRLHKDNKKHFLWLDRHLSDQRLKQIKAYNCSDIYFLAEPERFYPFPAAAHIIGFTNIDNIGIAGIEVLFNQRLGGTPTTVILEKDARSDYFYFRKEVKEQGQRGDPVELTIDRNLQFFAFEGINKAVQENEAKGGAALIMDPDSGHILAMASCPGFDPNEGSISNLEITKNTLVTECFELGSVIKAFTALAALEEEVVTPDEQIDCEGKATYIDGFRVENWKSLGEGTHPFTEVLRHSNNVGIAKIAKRLGPKLYYHLERLGFGKPTGIGFPGERSGFVNPPRNWSRSSLIVLSFGYEIMATLLQLGRAFSVIANGGNEVQPLLVTKPKRTTTPLFASRLYSEKTVNQLKDILEIEGWVKDKYQIPGYRLMGKTGTARSMKDGRYSAKDHVYTYAGIVEKGNYKRVIITFIREPKEGKANIWASEIALPIFHDIAQKMIVYDLGQGQI